jgi:hypothetical protein
MVHCKPLPKPFAEPFAEPLAKPLAQMHRREISEARPAAILDGPHFGLVDTVRALRRNRLVCRCLDKG